MSLDTGRKLSQNNWTELPNPKEVVDRVHVLLAPKIHANRGLLFTNRNGNVIEDTIEKYDDEDEINNDVDHNTISIAENEGDGSVASIDHEHIADDGLSGNPTNVLEENMGISYFNARRRRSVQQW